jgi:murein DD-endopeptidase MepM/ murein hydrolase activator NlpD
MPSSWSTYNTFKPQAVRHSPWVSSIGGTFEGKEHSLTGHSLTDYVSASRYLAHLIIGVMLVILVQSVLPSALPTPLPRDPLAPASSETFVSTAVWSVEVSPSVRHLEHSAVPFTVRSLRTVLPMVEPRQRELRTDVFTYTVQPGDSVLGIAQKFGLKGNSLLWANAALAANPDFLKIGQELFILPVDGAYHLVAGGETLQSIADRYKVAPEAITGYGANRLTESGELTVGQRLIIPGGVMPEVVRRQQVAPQRASVTQAPQNASVGTGTFIWPTTGTLSQRYWEGHRAIDIASRARPPVSAADAGFVSYTQTSNAGYGKMVMIDHGNGYQTLYAHLDAYYVKVGQSVARGEVIGKVGSTGRSTGPHLHFEVIRNGIRSNPLLYLP